MVKPIQWPRTDPAALAAFDPETKVCSHNCGPSKGDPRTAKERLYLCDLCGGSRKGAEQVKTVAEPQIVRLHTGRPDLTALVEEIKQVVYARAWHLSIAEAIGALEMAKLEIRDEQ